MINAASLFGRILGGFGVDHLGRLNVLWPITTICGILCFCGWLVSDYMPGVVTFVYLYGFCSGIFISVTPAAIGQISPQEKLRNPEVIKSYTPLISFAISLLITKIDSIKALY